MWEGKVHGLGSSHPIHFPGIYNIGKDLSMEMWVCASVLKNHVTTTVIL